ncbi:MAG: Ig-like domain-containing protein [Ignavibacteriales bacterium]|nr:MAG: T9SS type A sorting domain-containing protein [Ignavibacteriaceae bacterium]MBW7872232.1 Ig-like domain-containing protein [Ignavibacteria bacterium]MCZ2144045.1 Ig-like domain-containing protein [Ignavibacteriales bacterium]OQY75922.1 MAG: hypothetical protein B6D45_04870 [Ignavibacteriales bacterium UTCHB3]MBV6445621.1 hypothetical protein [Ignavibacteriaceae bacterium]
MRILSFVVLLMLTIGAQNLQPEIKEYRNSVSLQGSEISEGFSLSPESFLTSERENALFKTPVFNFPKVENAPFIAMAISVKGSFHDAEDLIFTLTVDGKSEKLEIDDDQDPVETRYHLVTPLFIAEADAKKYSVTVRAKRAGVVIRSIEVVMINPGKSVPVEPTSSLNTEDTYPKPPVVSRTGWGCPIGQSTNCGPSSTNVTHLIVHHSAGANNVSDWPAILRSIYQLHTVTNGWCDVGYNYLIDPNGVIYEGRGGGDNVIGAHFCGYNSGTMGVCLLGTYTTVSPKQATLSSLAKILAWKADQKGIDPLGISYHPTSGRTIHHISGHRDGCSTECPGTAFYNNNLPNVRTDVLALITSIAPKVVSAFPASGANNVKAYQQINIGFSLQMDTTSVRKAISISPADSFSVSFPSISEVVISPVGLWEFSTQFTLKIDTIAKNIHGTPIDGNGDGTPGDPYFLVFTTTPPDNNPPQLLKAYPTGSDVSSLAEVMLVFDEEIVNYEQNLTIKEGNTSLNFSPINYNWNGEKCVLTFKTTNVFTEGKFYTLTIGEAIKDKIGNKLSAPIILDFHVPITSYTEGTVIDRFEGYGSWVQPLANSNTVGADTTTTGFTITGDRKIGGLFSGKLSFGFTGNENGKIYLTKSTGQPLPQGISSVGVWVFTDLNDQNISLVIQGDSEELVNMGTLTHYGWKFLNVTVDNTAGNKLFKGLVVKQISGGDDKGYLYLDNLQFNGTFTGVEEELNPEQFALFQNYPNPFNPETVIRFNLPIGGFVSGVVYDIMGKEVAVPVNGEFQAGQHSLVFDASSLASGVYLFRLNAGNNSAAIKMIVTK